VKAKLYKVQFGDAEFTRLKAAFPDGVCDWTRKGVGQVALGKPWQDFSTT